jgi:branched-chain amino acid transport system ATP-binding protein
LKIVLLDEPTAGLTQQEAREVVGTLSELRGSTGVATVIVSHDVMFLESLNIDRVVVLHHGKTFKEGTFTEIRKNEEVRTLFWGDNN